MTLQLEDCDLQELGLGKAELDFRDLDRMGVVRHSRGRGGRYTPAWASNDKKIQLIVYNYMWNYGRIFRYNCRPGVPMNELEANANRFKSHIAVCMKSMPPGQRKQWDQHLAATQNGVAATCVRLLYMAYRQGLRATDIAVELNMTPGAVRAKLCRINKIARRLFPAECSPRRRDYSPRRGVRKYRKQITEPSTISKNFWINDPIIQKMAQRRKEGAIYRELSAEFGVPIASIQYRLTKAGIVPHLQKPRLSRKVVASIIDRHNAGESLNKIAKEFGRAPSSIWEAVKRHASRCKREDRHA